MTLPANSQQERFNSNPDSPSLQRTRNQNLLPRVFIFSYSCSFSETPFVVGYMLLERHFSVSLIPLCRLSLHCGVLHRLLLCKRQRSLKEASKCRKNAGNLVPRKNELGHNHIDVL